jgi:hypothetical protein
MGRPNVWRTEAPHVVVTLIIGQKDNKVGFQIRRFSRGLAEAGEDTNSHSDDSDQWQQTVMAAFP